MTTLLYDILYYLCVNCNACTLGLVGTKEGKFQAPSHLLSSLENAQTRSQKSNKLFSKVINGGEEGH